MTKYEIEFKNADGERKTIKFACKYKRLYLVKATFELAFENRYGKKVTALRAKTI